MQDSSRSYYLFDFDGTLVDSMPTYIAAMLRILDENGVAYAPDIIKTITPLGINGTAAYYIHTLGVQMPEEQMTSLMKEYMLDAYLHTIPAKNNVIPVLQELKAQGACLNVLTASPHVTLDACLKRLGIYELFDHVWSCEDFSTTKADPDIYRLAAEQMHVPVEQVLFLDDNLNADLTALSAGMKVCGVFDSSSEDYVEEMKAATDFYIYDFQELLTLSF